MENVVLSPNVFQTSQVNGQRITVNHILHAEGEGFEVFIGHLPRNLYESELLPVLLAVGQLCELRIMMNFSGNNRGFAFARFCNKESAENAVKYLNNFEIRAGRRIVVIASKDRKKLFIGRLPRNLEVEKLSAILREVTKNIAGIEMRYFPKDGMRCQYCIVEYKTHTDACKARRELAINGKKVFQYDIIIDWALVDKEEIEAHKDLVRQKEISKHWINTNFNGNPFTKQFPVADIPMSSFRDVNPQLKLTERQTLANMAGDFDRSDGIPSPTDSFRSGGKVCEPKKGAQRGVRRINILNKSMISQPQRCHSSQQMKLSLFTTTMMECQLCGPVCRQSPKIAPSAKHTQCRKHITRRLEDIRLC